MNTRTLIYPATNCNFFIALPEAAFPSNQPIHASSRDYGFDFDEEELGRELPAPLPINPADQTIRKVDPEEFETRYIWFLS